MKTQFKLNLDEQLQKILGKVEEADQEWLERFPEFIIWLLARQMQEKVLSSPGTSRPTALEGPRNSPRSPRSTISVLQEGESVPELFCQTMQLLSPSTAIATELWVEARLIETAATVINDSRKQIILFVSGVEILWTDGTVQRVVVTPEEIAMERSQRISTAVVHCPLVDETGTALTAERLTERLMTGKSVATETAQKLTNIVRSLLFSRRLITGWTTLTCEQAMEELVLVPEKPCRESNKRMLRLLSQTGVMMEYSPSMEGVEPLLGRFTYAHGGEFNVEIPSSMSGETEDGKYPQWASLFNMRLTAQLEELRLQALYPWLAGVRNGENTVAEAFQSPRKKTSQRSNAPEVVIAAATAATSATNLVEITVPATPVRGVSTTDSYATAAATPLATDLAVDDRVLVRYRCTKEWYEGKIASVHRLSDRVTYDVQYDDGDFEERCYRRKIRFQNEKQARNCIVGQAVDAACDALEGQIVPCTIVASNGDTYQVQFNMNDIAAWCHKYVDIPPALQTKTLNEEKNRMYIFADYKIPPAK